jgi:hypothetical protein
MDKIAPTIGMGINDDHEVWRVAIFTCFFDKLYPLPALPRRVLATQTYYFRSQVLSHDRSDGDRRM